MTPKCSRASHWPLSRARSIQPTPPHPTSRIHFNINLPPTLGLPSGLFPSGFSTQILHAFHFAPVRDNLIFLDFIILIMLGEYKLCSSSLCSSSYWERTKITHIHFSAEHIACTFIEILNTEAIFSSKTFDSTMRLHGVISGKTTTWAFFRKKTINLMWDNCVCHPFWPSTEPNFLFGTYCDVSPESRDIWARIVP
jgi:hypothetical protein